MVRPRCISGLRHFAGVSSAAVACRMSVGRRAYNLTGVHTMHLWLMSTWRKQMAKRVESQFGRAWLFACAEWNQQAVNRCRTLCAYTSASEDVFSKDDLTEGAVALCAACGPLSTKSWRAASGCWRGHFQDQDGRGLDPCTTPFPLKFSAHFLADFWVASISRWNLL